MSAQDEAKRRWTDGAGSRKHYTLVPEDMDRTSSELLQAIFGKEHVDLASQLIEKGGEDALVETATVPYTALSAALPGHGEGIIGLINSFNAYHQPDVIADVITLEDGSSAMWIDLGILGAMIDVEREGADLPAEQRSLRGLLSVLRQQADEKRGVGADEGRGGFTP